MINNSKIRILHIITGLDSGGAENNLVNIAKNIDKKKFDLHIVSLTGKGSLGNQILQNEIPLHIFYANSSDFTIIRYIKIILIVIKIMKLIRKIKPHLIQTWLHHADLIGFICALITGHKNLIWSIRCSDLKSGYISLKNRILVKVLSFFSYYPSVILFNSEAGLKAHLASGYKPKKNLCIFNGIDTKKFKPDLNQRNTIRNKLNILEEDPIIGFVGKYENIKDVNTFLFSIREVQKKISNLYVIMIGSDLSEDNYTLLDSISNLNLKNIKLIGITNNVAQYMQSFDLLLSTSLSEGFPNVIAEAMSCGVPCIATDVGDSKKIIGETGRVHVIKSYIDISKSCLSILSKNKKDKIKLSQISRQRIIDKYDILSITSQYEIFYKGLI